MLRFARKTSRVQMPTSVTHRGNPSGLPVPSDPFILMVESIGERGFEIKPVRIGVSLRYILEQLGSRLIEVQGAMRHGCNILVAPAYKTMVGSTSAESPSAYNMAPWCSGYHTRPALWRRGFESRWRDILFREECLNEWNGWNGLA